MEWIEWVLSIVAGVIVATVIWIGKIISDLPRMYVPRVQVDARFRELEDRLHNDMTAQEGRTDRQLDKLDGKLDKILQKLDGKLDK